MSHLDDLEILKDEYIGLAPDMGAYENPDIIVRADYENVQKAFSLFPCSPNPFNASTTISFMLPEASSVKVTLYNIDGQEVAVLVDSPMHAGSHQVTWDAEGCASGLYFCRLETGSAVQVQKMMVVR